jgi:hypothetical protein
MSHWTLSVSGAAALGASPRVRPTSCDHPRESVYLSALTFIFFCFKERRILRFLFLGWEPLGAFAAMGINYRLAWLYSITSAEFFTKIFRNTVHRIVNNMSVLFEFFNQRRSSV